MTRLAIALASALCLGASCHQRSAAPSPSSIEAACANLQRLGCPGGQATDGGAPCAEVIATAFDAGASFNLPCIASATSCAAADSCN